MAKDTNKQTLKEKMVARQAKRAADGGGSAAPAEAPTAAQGPTPAVNPPEQLSPEEQAKPLTADEQAANDPKKGKGKTDEAATAAASAAASTTEPKPAGRGRGRPRGSTAAKTANGVSHEQAFVGIFSAAVAAGGEERHMTAAEKSWALYKTEFMADG